MVNCGDCGKATPKFGRNRRGKVVEYRLCTECFRARRPEDSQAPTGRPERRPQAQQQKNAAISDSRPDPRTVTSDSGVFEMLGALRNSFALKPPAQGSVDNLVYDTRSGWQSRNSKRHPMVTLSAELDSEAYVHIGCTCPVAGRITVPCISDTGAQSCLMGLNTMRQLGMTESDLVPVARKMRAVNDEEISLSGAAFLRLSGRGKDGTLHQAPGVCVPSRRHPLSQPHGNGAAEDHRWLLPRGGLCRGTERHRTPTCLMWMPRTPRSP